jgi:hypothetical protein
MKINKQFAQRKQLLHSIMKSCGIDVNLERNQIKHAWLFCDPDTYEKGWKFVTKRGLEGKKIMGGCLIYRGKRYTSCGNRVL